MKCYLLAHYEYDPYGNEMTYLIGIAILIIGFFIQFLTAGRVDAFILFIIGFYVLLRFGKVPEKYAIVRKTALVGLFCFIAVLVVNMALFRFFVAPDPMRDSIWTRVLFDWDWVYFPFNKVVMILFPYGKTELLTGYQSLLRILVYGPIKDFLNILLYVGVGAGVGAIRKGGRMKVEE